MRGLRKVRPRIDNDRLPRKTKRHGLIALLLEEAMHLGSDIPVETRLLPPHFRRRRRVHDHEGRRTLPAHGRQLRMQESTDIVDDVRARLQGCLGDLRLVRVDADEHGRVRRADPLDDRKNAIDLLTRVNRRHPGDGGFATDVDDVCALLDQG